MVEHVHVIDVLCRMMERWSDVVTSVEGALKASFSVELSLHTLPRYYVLHR